MAHASDATVLLEHLRGLAGGSGRENSLVLISLAALPQDDVPESLPRVLGERMNAMAARWHGRHYALSPLEHGLLLRLGTDDSSPLIQQVREALYSLVDQAMPGAREALKPDHLVRVVDLRRHMENAVLLVKRLGEVGSTDTEGGRPLREEDLVKVERTVAMYGSSAFFASFVRSQPVVMVRDDTPPQVVMTEYYVAMDRLCGQLLRGVDVRANRNLFRQLTLTLDRILLEAFPEAMPDKRRCALNINVDSVLDPAFGQFVRRVGGGAMNRLSFEFRQEDILGRFDEFQLASDYLRSQGALLAVDGVLPETVGLVDLPRLGASLAKVFWRAHSAPVLRDCAADVREWQRQEIAVVLARVDDEEALATGRAAAITLYQGFALDRRLARARARAGLKPTARA